MKLQSSLEYRFLSEKRHRRLSLVIDGLLAIFFVLAPLYLYTRLVLWRFISSFLTFNLTLTSRPNTLLLMYV